MPTAPVAVVSDLDTAAALALGCQHVDGTVDCGRDGVQMLQDGDVVCLNLRRGHDVIREDILGLHGTGEGNVVHTLLVLVHLVLVAIEHDDILELQAFGGVDGGQYEVGVRRGVVLLCLLVAGGKQGLFDGVLADFELDHVVLDIVQHLFLGDLAFHALTDPGLDGRALLGRPVVQHLANAWRCLLVCIDQERQTCHDFLTDDVDDVVIRGELDVVPVFLDKGGHHGGVVHLLRHQAYACRVGVLTLQDLLDDRNVPAGKRQDGNLLFAGEALLDIRADLQAEDAGQLLMEVVQLVQLVIVEPHMVEEALLRDLCQAVGLQLDLGVLVRLDVLKSHVGEVQDLLIGTVVDVQLVGGKRAGAFQDVQGPGVGCAEFVERLAAIRYDTFLEKNSTNFWCLVFILNISGCIGPDLLWLTIPFCLSYYTEYWFGC